MVLWYKSVDLLKIKEKSNPKEFYRRIMELAEKEAAEFKNWNSSMNQKDHKDWFRGMYITLLEKYINKYYTVDLNMCLFLVLPMKFRYYIVFQKTFYTSLCIK